jgi:hypothetical protein
VQCPLKKFIIGVKKEVEVKREVKEGFREESIQIKRELLENKEL